MEQRDFFISYTNADEAWAVWIANVLKSNGYTVYIQAFDIKPGDNFLEKMNEFLKNSANFIAVWSARYFDSQYCKDELNSTYIQRNKGRMKYLFLIRIDSRPIEPLYAGLVHIDLPDMSTASETKLMDAVRHAVSHSKGKPPQLESDDKSLKPIRLWNGFHYYNLMETLFIDFFSCVLLFVVLLTVGLFMGGTFINAREFLLLSLLHVLLFAYSFLSGEPDNFLGDYYYRQGNYHQALQCYMQAVGKKERPDALIKLGFLYTEGLGVEQDYAKAREYYKRAATKGSAMALYNLGELYEKGRGVKKNYAKALGYYQKAANAGNEDASAKVKKLRVKMHLQ